LRAGFAQQPRCGQALGDAVEVAAAVHLGAHARGLGQRSGAPAAGDQELCIVDCLRQRCHRAVFVDRAQQEYRHRALQLHWLRNFAGGQRVEHRAQRCRQGVDTHPLKPPALGARPRSRNLPRGIGKCRLAVQRRNLRGNCHRLRFLPGGGGNHDLGKQHAGATAPVRQRRKRMVDLGFRNRYPARKARPHQFPPGRARFNKVAQRLRCDLFLGKLCQKLLGGQVGARGKFFHRRFHLIGAKPDACGTCRLHLHALFDQHLFGFFFQVPRCAQHRHEPHALINLEPGNAKVIDHHHRPERVALCQRRNGRRHQRDKCEEPKECAHCQVRPLCHFRISPGSPGATALQRMQLRRRPPPLEPKPASSSDRPTSVCGVTLVDAVKRRERERSTATHSLT